ncbi:MAG: PrsW family intramembrane metalloprotease [Candidatus Thermoplasmatota archaeon]|jgi:RsiW-degrading membrane proteinase PrsW (M82 family)|nr:PrsW family intramembrane metalloprotease [Candidatus Thermoplasmatota archaeon]
MSTLLTWGLLVFLSFLPPLIYTIWIRNTERCHRQQWISIFVCFLWGSTIAVLAALILEIILQIPLESSYSLAEITPFLAVVVIAPIVEEFTKPLALRLRTVRSQLSELEDGLIYGAVAGLGFSATENLLYGFSFLEEGFVVFLMLMAMRSVGGCLLHASATALTGYGFGKTVMKRSSFLGVLPYFLLAIFLHGFYNFLVSYEMFGLLSGLILAFLFVLLAITIIRKKIRTLDSQNC